MRDHFSFNRAFKDAINALTDIDRLAMYEAITDYGLDQREPNLHGALKVVFDLIRPTLDVNIQRWRNGCKGGEYGNKGGAPKGNKNATKKNNPKTTARQPQDNPEVGIITEKGDAPTIPPAKRFTKPTLLEVKDFLREKSISIDAERFYNYYESNGWKVGKNPMKDWHAAVRTWERQNIQGKSADVGVILRDNNPDKYNAKLW